MRFSYAEFAARQRISARDRRSRYLHVTAQFGRRQVRVHFFGILDQGDFVVVGCLTAERDLFGNGNREVLSEVVCSRWSR